MRLCPKCSRIVSAASICDDTQCPIEEILVAPAKPDDAFHCPVCGKGYPASIQFCEDDGSRLVALSPTATDPEQTQISERLQEEPPEETIDDPSPVLADPPVLPAQTADPERRDQTSERVSAKSCPSCHRTFHSGISFCEHDGTPLVNEGEAVASVSLAATQLQTDNETEEYGYGGRYSEKRRSPFPIIAAVLALCLAGGAGYAYWTGLIGDRPSRVAEDIQSAVHAEGYLGVKVALNKDWQATLSGTARGQKALNKVLSLVRSNSDVRSIDSQITVLPTTQEQLAALREALERTDLPSLEATADSDGKLSVSGALNNAAEKQTLAALIAVPLNGASVEDRTTQSRGWIERDIGSALRSAGLYTVRAIMITDSKVALSGTVSKSEDTGRAAKIAIANGATDVQSSIQIVAQKFSQPRPTYGSEVQQATGRSMPQKFRGTRRAQFRNGLSNWLGVVELSGGQIGASVGRTAYATVSGNKVGSVQCVFNLILTQVSATSITVEEQRVKRSIVCPGNKRIVFTHRGGRSLYGQWLRKKNNSVAFQTTLQ